MKIVQILSGVSIPLSEEEQQFFEKYQEIKLTSLNERQKWIAQNLVRRGIFSISNDDTTLVKTAK
jgi:hypothetical protein